MRGSMRQPFFALTGAIILYVLTLAAAAGAWAEDKPGQVVIGYQPLPTAEIILKDQGWNETSFGVPVKWVPVSSGVMAHQALAAGNMDFALLGTSPTAAGVARGIPLQAIWIHDIIGDNEALVVRKDSGIEKVEQLKGKTVAAPFGSTTHYHLMVALMLGRVGDREVTIINLEPRDLLAAWKKGEIDAGFVWEPTLAKMVTSGGKVILTSRELAEKGFPTANLCVVRKEFGEKYPSIAVQYVKNLDRAIKFYRSNSKEGAAAVARQLGMSQEEAERQMRGVILLTGQEQDAGKYFGGEHWNFGLYTVLKETGDFLKKQDVVQSLPPREAFMKAVNARFLVEAIEE